MSRAWLLLAAALLLACGGSVVCSPEDAAASDVLSTEDASTSDAQLDASELVCRMLDGAPVVCEGGAGFVFYADDAGTAFNCAGPFARCVDGERCVRIDPNSGGPVADGGEGACSP